jgi:hypothetical protein
VLVHHSLPAFLSMAAVSLLALPLAARLTSPVGGDLGDQSMPVAVG